MDWFPLPWNIFIILLIAHRIINVIIHRPHTFRLRLDDPVETCTELTANNSAHFACVGSLIYASSRHRFIKAEFSLNSEENFLSGRKHRNLRFYSRACLALINNIVYLGLSTNWPYPLHLSTSSSVFIPSFSLSFSLFVWSHLKKEFINMMQILFTI